MLERANDYGLSRGKIAVEIHLQINAANLMAQASCDVMAMHISVDKAP